MVSIILSNSHGKLAKPVSFLDISVSINCDALATSVSYKPTHSHSYLLFSSSNPNHTKQSTPYTQFLLLRRLWRDDKDFETKTLEMRTVYVERSYPTHRLDSAIEKSFSDSHWHTLKPPLAKISDDKIPLVLTFHPFNYKVKEVVSRNFQILKNDPETSAIFTDNPLISFTTFLVVKVANFTSVKRTDVYLTDLQFVFSSKGGQSRRLTFSSHFFTPLFMFMFIHLPALIHFAPPPRLLIDFKNSK